ncbi:Uncharacterized conserved protein YbaA, DUF1428 family [Gemmobacter megaterium]|uniref:Uncharacterized conserved protein YbaA, DUF1428 family n=1 Tax=Gemmobacter megaterium TaxID=1086013 RepID=A0A1N7QMF7_9RHOB|nr:DUF1428 domain-containing protein [Gemmobacter megaterium]GGE27925.1 hypothetical protein GCM10011345_37510 [Gemmobacter megaterium]SIT24075.1 Uncharacterized conserved protein YbaA, DUF1428 family [Gemmobacter megaterium]
MSFVDGFVAAVPAANKQAYIDHARATWPLFQKYGAVAMRECWGEDVPDGKVTSFPMAVKAEPGEVVVFSWIEWPDKATRDACWAASETDPGFQNMGEMPFDGKRMIYGGFSSMVNCA